MRRNETAKMDFQTPACNFVVIFGGVTAESLCEEEDGGTE